MRADGDWATVHEPHLPGCADPVELSGRKWNTLTIEDLCGIQGKLH